MSTRPRHRPGRRAGFTLIEILVVIGIVGILAGLVVSGIFQYIETQKQTNTETLIRTLDKALKQQWEHVVAEARKEEPSARTLALAGGDMRRAQVMWIKFRLVEAFPVTFGQIVNPPLYQGGNNAFIPPMRQRNLAAYKKALQGVTKDTGKIPTHSSVCLRLALKHLQGGGGLSMDQIAYALADVNGDGLQEIVDGWGTPLVFYRFPSGNAELNQSNPATTAAGKRFADPLDPDGTLVDPAWNNQNNYYNPSTMKTGPVHQYEGLVTSHIHANGYEPPPAKNDPPPPPYSAVAHYTVPTIVSCGRNGKLGLGALMQITNTKQSDDNIYSFRLRLGARGD
jgi:prepilin-type N-terminal cleavage/methylation domain-containing protein